MQRQRQRNRQARRGKSFQAEPLEHRICLDSTVVFNEVMYNPAGATESQGEWIELHNQLTVDMDISEWRLAGGVNYTFPDGTIVPGGGYLLVASDPKFMQNQAGGATVLGPWSGRLSNSGETLRLYNNDERLMNDLTYDDTSPWPASADGGGASLVKADPATATHRDNSWTFSRHRGGTPGTGHATALFTESLVLNEIVSSDAADGEFFIEIANLSDRTLDIAGVTLVSSETNTPIFTFGPTEIAPSELVTVTESQLGGRPRDTDRITVVTADGQTVLDGQRVTGSLRGRDDAFGGEWLYPQTPTPGKANAFQLSDDIVINEIMYHPAPLPTVLPLAPRYERTTLIPMTWDQWKYNATGAGLPAGWAAESYAVDNEVWQLGQALMGTPLNDLPLPIRTEFPPPRDNDPPFTTFYFQTEFEIDAQTAARIDLLEISHIINDGAIFYLNGQEVGRFNMPAGDVDPDTRAKRSMQNDANGVGPIDVPVELLTEGTNTLSVELHLVTRFDRNIVFGTRLLYATQTAAATEGIEFQNRDQQEWIELYNRGTTTIDLEGWQLTDAIEYEFPAGAMLAPDSYLVVARNVDVFSEIYPEVPVWGSFAGRLSNHDDRIRLLDANRNPADEVHYFESGTWPTAADGGGASLELRDPLADNSPGASWSASDDAAGSNWVSYSFQDVSREDVFTQAPLFQEFIFGLLSAGEFLIDDIQVIEDPNGESISLLQNGDFQADILGTPPDKWRLIGNHSGIVTTDPHDPRNHVLHVTATGAHQYVHDHAETTFRDGLGIQDGAEYQISFRARWLSGSRQLHSRLFLNRVPNTMHLHVPTQTGTPAAPNSTRTSNLGPSLVQLHHTPTMPSPTESVTVTVHAADPQGVDTVALSYRADGQPWTRVVMAASGDDTYAVSIPAHAEGTIVQFYAEARDTLGEISMLPAAGPNSRALFQVEDGIGSTTAIEDVRLIVMEAELTDLISTSTQRMSNRRLPTTMNYGDQVYYDAGIRLTGSRFTRPHSGYNVDLGAENALYGVHDSIRIDINGISEILAKQMLNRAGISKASNYDDLAYVVVPIENHVGPAIIQLARYENLYFAEQFENGADGTKFKMDDIVAPSRPIGEESLKSATEVDTGTDIGVSPEFISVQGGNPEFFRAHQQIRSNRERDDFLAIVRLASAIHLEGSELFEATNEALDVDLWLRHYAHQSFLGNGDSYGGGRPKNLRLFVRPSDGRVLPLMWDCDNCSATGTLMRTSSVSRLDEIRDIPHNLRIYWGHLLDLVEHGFNEQYVARWANHYQELVGENVGGSLTFGNAAQRIRDQANNVHNTVETIVPRINFAITTGAGQPIEVEQPTVMLEGTGWVDIRQIRLAGSTKPIEAFWPTTNTWQLEVPLSQGRQTIELEAIGFRGELIATQSIDVTSLAANPVVESLYVTEIHYHPSPPTDDEVRAGFVDQDDFEFLELYNAHATDTLELTGLRLAGAVELDLNGIQLSPGEYAVVVEDQAAFARRYGSEIRVLGQWSGRLSNGGDRVTIENAAGTRLIDIPYRDSAPWPERADGAGASLQIADVANTPRGQEADGTSWRGSTEWSGSPGRAGAEPIGIVINEVVANTDQVPGLSDSIELHNPTSETVDVGGWYLSDSTDNLLKFRIPTGTQLAPGGYQIFSEADFNPTPATPAANHFGLSGSRGDDVWLVRPSTSDLTFVDDVHFGASRSGEPWGRTPNGTGRLAPLAARTLGAFNSVPRVGSIVISELNFQPESPSTAALAIEPALTANDLEFIEVHNPTAETIDLSGWRTRGGADLDFAPGASLAAGETLLLVAFDPDDIRNANRTAAFREHYRLGPDVRLTGDFGQLSDRGERIELQRLNRSAGSPAYLWEDEVLYDDFSPWPVANGNGKSLTRTGPLAFGSWARSWSARAPSPGRVEYAADLNADDQVDAQDIDLVAAAIRDDDLRFDLDEDGEMSLADLDFMIRHRVGTTFGDTNLDGRFDAVDLVLAATGGHFEDDSANNSSWETSDWNGDGEFDSSDFVLAFQTGMYIGG